MNRIDEISEVIKEDPYLYLKDGTKVGCIVGININSQFHQLNNHSMDGAYEYFINLDIEKYSIPTNHFAEVRGTL